MSNLLGLPVGAPKRPGFGTYLFQFLMFETAFLGAAIVNLVNHSFWGWGLLSIFALLLCCAIALTKYFDSTGWYKQVEVSVPPLPFEHGLRGSVGYTLFTADRLIYQENSSTGYREVAYTHIKRVEIAYFKSFPNGVTVVETGKVPVEIRNAPEFYMSNAALMLTCLYLLKQLAPQAQFSGEANAMKDGWIRLTLNYSPLNPNSPPLAEVPPVRSKAFKP